MRVKLEHDFCYNTNPLTDKMREEENMMEAMNEDMWVKTDSPILNRQDDWFKVLFESSKEYAIASSGYCVWVGKESIADVYYGHKPYEAEPKNPSEEVSSAMPSVDDIRVSYWYKDVQNAAQWISKNNPAGFSYQEVEDSIYRSILSVITCAKEAIEKDPEWDKTAKTGTMGYTVLLSWDDVDWATVEVLVDPSLNKRPKGVHAVTESFDTLIEYLDDYRGD